MSPAAHRWSQATNCPSPSILSASRWFFQVLPTDHPTSSTESSGNLELQYFHWTVFLAEKRQVTVSEDSVLACLHASLKVNELIATPGVL